LQKLVKEWIGPGALAAIVLGILCWFLVDKFASINEKIDDKFTAANTKIVDKFSALDKRIDDKFGPLNGSIQDIKKTASDLNASVSGSASANSALKDLLNSSSARLVEQINETVIDARAIDSNVNALNQQMHNLSDSINRMEASLSSLTPLPGLVSDINGRVGQIEGVLIQAPWNRKPE
jgi:methyl-accepting chemotaxis protein